MKRYGFVLLLTGCLIGVAIGRTSVNSQVPSEALRSSLTGSMDITFPHSFFANQPQAEDSEHRTVEVQTFTFPGPSSNGLTAGQEVVLPVIRY